MQAPETVEALLMQDRDMADISASSSPMEDQSSAGLNRRQVNRGGGGIFKSAAVAVLRSEGRLMTTGEITRCRHRGSQR